jgi:radical SAM-linked protein
MDESPFAVRQRIYTALPLPLGATSDDEVLELWLTKKFENLDEVRMKLEQQLPRGIQITSVQEAEVKKADGSNGEKMSQLLSSVEYYISLDDDASLSDSEREQSLQHAINSLLSLDSLVVERKHKKKKGKVVKADVRQGLESLELAHDEPSKAICASLPVRQHTTVVKFRCNCLNGNPSIAPDTLASALSTMSSGNRFSVQHVHRSQICFREPSRSKPNMDRIRSLVRQEGHLAAAKIFQRSGPWSQGLENRFDVP